MAEDSMSENGRRVSLGVQAYRWLVAAGMGILVLLSQRTLAGIDETANSVRDLKAQVATMQGTTESRFNAHAQRLDMVDRRNDTQDTKIDGLWQRLWSFQSGPTGPRGTP